MSINGDIDVLFSASASLKVRGPFLSMGSLGKVCIILLSPGCRGRCFCDQAKMHTYSKRGNQIHCTQRAPCPPLPQPPPCLYSPPCCCTATNIKGMTGFHCSVWQRLTSCELDRLLPLGKPLVNLFCKWHPHNLMIVF